MALCTLLVNISSVFNMLVDGEVALWALLVRIWSVFYVVADG